jgi:hypothetical protein
MPTQEAVFDRHRYARPSLQLREQGVDVLLLSIDPDFDIPPNLSPGQIRP